MDARAWDKIRKKKQFFQGIITWSVLKKKKTFMLKTSIAESASISV